MFFSIQHRCLFCRVLIRNRLAGNTALLLDSFVLYQRRIISAFLLLFLFSINYFLFYLFVLADIIIIFLLTRARQLYFSLLPFEAFSLHPNSLSSAHAPFATWMPQDEVTQAWLLFFAWVLIISFFSLYFLPIVYCIWNIKKSEIPHLRHTGGIIWFGVCCHSGGFILQAARRRQALVVSFRPLVSFKLFVDISKIVQ